MVMRFIEDELVYDSSWSDTCCKLGHALRESYSLKDSIKCVPLYRISSNQRVIVKDFCCPNCYSEKQHKPNVFKTLKEAMNTLISFKVTSQLLGENNG